MIFVCVVCWTSADAKCEVVSVRGFGWERWFRVYFKHCWLLISTVCLGWIKLDFPFIFLCISNKLQMNKMWNDFKFWCFRSLDLGLTLSVLSLSVSHYAFTLIFSAPLSLMHSWFIPQYITFLAPLSSIHFVISFLFFFYSESLPIYLDRYLFISHSAFFNFQVSFNLS